MDRAEVEGLVATTRDHEVVLLREPVPELAGWLREVIVRRDWRIIVEVRQVGFDEGGVIFEACPGDAASAIRLLEHLVQTPIESWHRVLDVEREFVLEQYGRGVVEWIRSDAPDVPPMPPFTIRSSYWRDQVANDP
jgi:hypothetical protein